MRLRTIDRVALILGALLCGGYIASLGITDSMAARTGQAEDGAFLGSLYWIAVGALVALPFWLPLILPARFEGAARMLRWPCVAGLGLLGAGFGLLAGTQLASAIQGRGLSPTFLATELLVTVTCFLGAVILIRAGSAARRAGPSETGSKGTGDTGGPQGGRLEKRRRAGRGTQ